MLFAEGYYRVLPASEWLTAVAALESAGFILPVPERWLELTEPHEFSAEDVAAIGDAWMEIEPRYQRLVLLTTIREHEILLQAFGDEYEPGPGEPDIREREFVQTMMGPSYSGEEAAFWGEMARLGSGIEVDLLWREGEIPGFGFRRIGGADD